MESIIEVNPAGHYSYFIEIGIVRIKGATTRPWVSNLPEVRATLFSQWETRVTCRTDQSLFVH